MKKLIIAAAAIALTTGASMAQVVSSQYIYGDAPAPTQPSQNLSMGTAGSASIGGVDYGTTASISTRAQNAQTDASSNPLGYNALSTTLRGAGNQR
ncbi:hypothetical protein ABFT80_02055 [Mesorhizobium sp. SB112]|uniref:hypothetical protein n=1 Tax=Mesorhizobium sp. SB112 TaxID=3151853 RepID=UPI003266EC36